MSNWFKIHRDIFDSDIWHDVTTFRLFMLLIGKATHQDGINVAGIELKRGQYLRSYRKLAEDLAYLEGRGTKEYSLRTIKNCIDKLIKAERVLKQETEQGTLFTVLNYSKYQGLNDPKNETGNGTGNEGETFGKRSVNNNKNAKNAKKEKNNNSHKFSTRDMSLAKLLFERIKENNPNHKEPNLERWANDIRLMRERDNRTEEQIEYLINWCQNDSFWHTNILSAAKLRAQFDKLVLQVKREKKGSKVVPMRRESQYDNYDYGF